MAEDDRDRFEQFWVQLEKTIDDAIAKRLVRVELQNSLAEVWERDTRPSLLTLRKEMHSNWSKVRPALQDVELAGRSLDVKMGELLEAGRRWDTKRDKRSLRSFLQWTKIMLGSLIAALVKSLPYLRDVAEVVKEFVETLEQAVADTE